MSGFELFFSLFGLILGLAIASVASGMSDLLRERNRIPLGVLTPMLVAFVLADLTSFWITSWGGLQKIRVGFPSMFWATTLAVTYFFAATMVIPKRPEEWKSLDDYYLKNYRWVIGGVMVANLGLLALAAAINDRGFFGLIGAAFSRWPNWVFYIALTTLLVFRQRVVHYVCYGVLFFGYIYIIARNPTLR